MDEQEFIETYGETTADGIPRFGDDYSFLHAPSELSISDAYKIGGFSEAITCIKQDLESFWCGIGDVICDKFEL